jgi:hypothetical protein
MSFFQAFRYILIVFSTILLFNACSKPGDNPTPTPTPASPVTPPTAPLFTVDSKWGCQVDGVAYSGTIDTSFISFINPGGSTLQDTLLECNGTSFDKKANIHFRVRINRTSTNFRDISTNYYNGWISFDTVSTKFLIAGNGNLNAEVIFHVDTIVENKLKMSFQGKMYADNNSSQHTVANGKFSCEFGKGNNEPKFFSFKVDATGYAGFFTSANLVSNALILDGLPYSADGGQRFRMILKTGGTIKPGTYTSAAGEVGLQFYTPSIYPFYVNDSLGSLLLTISSVTANIVKGYFSGTNKDGKVISNGLFSCQVKNYVPQIDSVNKWSFCEDDYTFFYNIYGGNIIDAKKTQAGNNHVLTVNGESDNGTSRFKLILSSTSAIAQGKVYSTDNFPSSQNSLDSLSFNSNTKIWNGILPFCLLQVTKRIAG